MTHPNDLIEVPSKEHIVSNGNTKFRIRFITDTHIKGDGFREDLFNKFINEQKKDPDSFWIHGGDNGDPDRNSRREIDEYSNANRKGEIITQNEKNKLWVEHFIIPKYEKIKDSCLGLIAGDHWMVIDGKPCTEYIANRLGVPYLGEREGYAAVRFITNVGGAFLYIIHARHGKGGASTPGGDMGALIKQEIGFVADLHLGGHTHKSNIHNQVITMVNSKCIRKEKISWFMRGGSFLDKPNYAKKAEYTPLPCGWGEIELNISRMYHGKDKSRPFYIDTTKCSIIAG